jgi:Ca2+/Na+ antiporter
MLAVAIATSDIVALFACAGIVLYIAARAAVDAVTSPADPAPGKMALAHWMPIAWAAVLATLAGHSEVGIGLALATSVAAVALVLGVLLCIRPDEPPAGLTRAGAWPFVLPAAVLILLAGFTGSLNWFHALMLLALGACVTMVWRSREADDQPPFAAQPRGPRALPPDGGFTLSGLPPAGAAPNPSATSVPSDQPSTRRADDHRYWRAQLALAIALGAVGGWLGYKGITVADDRTRVATSGLISLAVLGPLLVLSLLGTGAVAVHHGRFGSVMGTVVGLVLLNLCLLLPLVILAHYARELFLTWHAAAAPLTLDTLADKIRPAPFPIGVWRIDTVLLIVLGLMLIPVSLGRWKLGKLEGLGLAFVYAAYLITSTALAIRL